LIVLKISSSFFKSPKRLENKENLISFVGRLDREKNAIALLEIFKESKIHTDWKLQIIGDGKEKNNLEKFVEENQLKNRVIFHGTKNSYEILELLRKSKIFGFTSLKEALPTVLVEAMFCGNAIVSYNCDYGPSDIINEKNGFLIYISDRESFKEKLEFLTNNEDALNNLMTTSFSESKNWNKEKILEKWKLIFI
jgi:glycosyltransferase involved in cell wall biosynthesis